MLLHSNRAKSAALVDAARGLTIWRLSFAEHASPNIHLSLYPHLSLRKQFLDGAVSDDKYDEVVA
jgi:hypothetical protein